MGRTHPGEEPQGKDFERCLARESLSVATVYVLAKCSIGSDVMDVLVVGDPLSQTNPRFVTEFDAIPGFWNYLVDLDRNDLIAELIQNDLDQGATRTVVSFERTCLVCDGNGMPVEPEGWQRLRKILGAGDEVPAKRRRFGVKNHGLKTAFTIADEIRLMSDGKAVVQTLYANGRNSPPYPGASEHPMEDRQAPAVGCRVIAYYREAALEPSQGEAIKLPSAGVEEIDALFQSACASLPEQFAGIVSPEITPRYEIVLRHWRLGQARFIFSCSRPRKIAKRMELFRRRCTVSGTLSPLPEGLLEQAFRRLVPLKGVLKDRAADFFCRGRRFFVEVSWPTNAKGKPRTGTGKFRYPIGYPPKSHEARTGHSTHFNAPFASDKERHAPARNEATNSDLREACDSLLIDALASHAIPRWGTDGLKPVAPNSDADNGDEVVRPLLAELAKRGALPVLNWRKAAELAVRGKKQSVEAVARQSAVRPSSQAKRRYRFVLPIPTWKAVALDPSLSLLCPRSERQLDPRTPNDIVRLLADGKTPGFVEDYITFDEDDVFCRLTADGNKWFGPIIEPEREFSEPFVVRAYLDLIKLALDEGKLEAEKEDKLVSVLLLPDDRGQATSFLDLYSSASLPSGIPGLHLPPVLSRDLVGHALFRRKKWKLRKFTMAEFLEGGIVESADERTRRQFWKWLCQNERRVSRRDRVKLGALAIWPDDEGRLWVISDLCDPRARRVGRVLGDSIHRPHEQVRRSRLVSLGGKSRTSIRRVPTHDEVARWLAIRTAGFEVGSTPDATTASELTRFEGDLVMLLTDAAIARQFKRTQVSLPALARDRSLGARTALVMPSRKNARLALPSRFLLKDREHSASLNRLSAPLNGPTADMLLSSFVEDPSNFAALQPRLRYFLSVTDPNDGARVRLAGIPIVPVHGEPRAPFELAFRGTRGDYWGAWKTYISGKGLSQDDQRRYRDSGVTSSMPSALTSRAFFAWLSEQDEVVVGRHIPCVLRHILHRAGPTDWATSFTDTPFIPAEGRDGVQLVSLRTARSRPVYLSDAGDIGDAVICGDGAVLLVIDHVKEVNEPISEELRRLGIRSLRESIKAPRSVSGSGGIVGVGKEVLTRIHELQSSGFRGSFRKRLNELGVEAELVRHDWQDGLARVQEIRVAENVEARFVFRGKSYALEIDAGLDSNSGIFYMRSGKEIEPSSLYESIAKQLIFKPTARPIHLLALERAVTLEIDDPSFGLPSGRGTRASHGEIVAEEEGLAEYTNGDAEPREAAMGHSPFEPDPERNKPEPAPIPTEPAGRPLSGRPKSVTSGASGRGDGSRQTTQLEKDHRDALKRDHYSSHCQMCLCERSPQELAPAGSYVEWEEVRRNIVDAHHADLVSAGGARHAGNLILLCRLHHDNYGRQLNRAAITAAIRRDHEERTISFDEDWPVQGQQIELVIPGTGEVIKLFFTDHHIEYWLSQETATG